MFSQDKCMCVCNTFFKYLCATFSTRVYHGMRRMGGGGRPWLPRAANIGSSTTRHPAFPPRGRRSDRGNAARAGETTVTARGHGSCRPHNRFSRHWPPDGWSLWKTRVTAGPEIPSVAFAGQGPVPLAMSTPRTGHHRERIPWTRSGHGERSGTGTGRWCVPRCLEGPCNTMAWHASSSSRPFRTRDLTLIWRQ